MAEHFDVVGVTRGLAGIDVNEHGHLTILQRLARLRRGAGAGSGSPWFSALNMAMRAIITMPPFSAAEIRNSIAICPRVRLRPAAAQGYKRQHRVGFEVRHRRRSESDQKNGGTNLFARRARLANYSPDFKTRVPPAACRQRLKVGDVACGAPNMLVGLGGDS